MREEQFERVLRDGIERRFTERPIACRRERFEPRPVRSFACAGRLAATLEVLLAERCERHDVWRRQAWLQTGLHLGLSPKLAVSDLSAPTVRERLRRALRLDVLADFAVDGEPEGRPSLRFEIEVPRVWALRPGAPRAVADFAKPAIVMSRRHQRAS